MHVSKTQDIEESTEQIISRLTRERDRAAAHELELLERCTELKLEVRRVDRRRMVREFFTVAQQAIGERPHVPNDEQVRFRLRLIAEEFFELLAAVPRGRSAYWVSIRKEVMDAIDDIIGDTTDLPELTDACVDLQYVVEGLMVAFGINSTDVWQEVQRSNLSKMGGPKRESDGKLMKPPGWTPPDIEGVLRAGGWTL